MPLTSQGILPDPDVRDISLPQRGHKLGPTLAKNNFGIEALRVTMVWQAHVIQRVVKATQSREAEIVLDELSGIDATTARPGLGT